MNNRIFILLATVGLLSQSAFASHHQEEGPGAPKRPASPSAHETALGVPDFVKFEVAANVLSTKLAGVNEKAVKMWNELREQKLDKDVLSPELDAFVTFDQKIGNELQDKDTSRLYAMGTGAFNKLEHDSPEVTKVSGIVNFNAKLVDDLVSLYDITIQMDQKGWGKAQSILEGFGLTKESFYNNYKEAFVDILDYVKDMPSGYIKEQFLTDLQKKITDANNRNQSLFGKGKSFLAKQSGFGAGFNDTMLARIDNQIKQLKQREGKRN